VVLHSIDILLLGQFRRRRHFQNYLSGSGKVCRQIILRCPRNRSRRVVGGDRLLRIVMGLHLHLQVDIHRVHGVCMGDRRIDESVLGFRNRGRPHPGWGRHGRSPDGLGERRWFPSCVPVLRFNPESHPTLPLGQPSKASAVPYRRGLLLLGKA
jgi:hypothetical protein